MIKTDRYFPILPFAIFVLAFVFTMPACADTFTVTNYDPNGAGSLSQAIDDLNTSAASGTIEFNEAAASGTIDLTGYVTSLGFETIFDLNSYNVTLENYVGGCTSWTKFDGATTGVLNIGSGTAWTNTWGVVIGDNTNGSLTVSNGGDFTISNEKTYIGSTSADSVGVLTVTGAGSTYVTNNDIYVGFNGTGTMTVADSAAVNVNGGAGIITIANAAGSEGTLNIGNGAAAGTINAAEITGGGGDATLVFNHTDAACAFGTLVSGSLDVVHNGTGTTTISGANTFTGTVTVNAGKVKLGDDSALGDQTSGTTVNSGGSLDLDGHDLFTAGEDEPLSIAGTGTAGEGALFNSSAGMSTYSGSITLTAASTIGVTGAAGSMFIYRNIDTGAAGHDITFDGAGDFLLMNTFTGKITGNGDVIKNGAGELLFYMTGSDYTGSTTVNEGRLTVGAAGVIPDDSALSIALGAELNLNGKNETIGSLSGAGNVINSGAACTLTAGGNDGSTTFSGAISDGTGATSFTKDGTGTLTLSGNNTYTGVTTMTDGVLSVATIGNGGVAGNLGAASNAAANLVLNGGTIRYTGLTASTDRSVTINNGTTTTIDIETNTLTMTGNGTTSGGTTGAITKAGAGTLVLTGTFTNTGITTISGGTLEFGDGFGGASDVLNNATLSVNRTIDLNAAAVFSGTGTFRHDGSGTTTMLDANTYTGATIVNAGTLKAGVATVAGVSGAFGNGSAVTLNGGSLSLNGFSNTVGSLNGAAASTIALGAGTLTTGGLGTADTYSGVISGTGGLTLNGAGSLVLSGANTYSGNTTITAGTLVASNASALGNGSAVTVGAGGTLDVGTNNVTVNNTYTQNGTLKVTVASPSSSGKITSNADAAVAAASSVNVTVPSGIYIPNNATFTVVDGAGGAGVNIPGTITSSDPRLKFSALSSSGDLILMVSRLGTGFSSIATDPNGAAVGAVLDNIIDPPADMTDVLNTLEGLDDQQVASALDTFVPVVDSGVVASSNLSLGQFIGTVTDRLAGLYARARGSAGGETGVSAGCEGLQGFEAWGQGFGEYLHQKPRGLSNGYRATVWGTAIGGDIPAFNNRVRMGLSGGYAQSDINSKDNSGKTDIDSYQGTLYAGYADVENPYYLNGAFSFAYNKYDSLRHIAVGTIMRTANSDYDGQQYSVMFDGGYTFKSGKVGITPIASLQYMRLHLEGYTEENAGALNLSVRSQNYDMLQSGLGMKLERPFETKTGTIIPEIHARWLYDFIGDRQETTSTFSGGGGSFATSGFDPAQNSLNAGAKVTLIANNNWVLETNYDFEYKEDFTAHTGWADVRYKF